MVYILVSYCIVCFRVCNLKADFFMSGHESMLSGLEHQDQAARNERNEYAKQQEKFQQIQRKIIKVLGVFIMRKWSSNATSSMIGKNKKL